MSYSSEDVSDLKSNLSSYPGIDYLGDVKAYDGEILSYWRPTIGLYNGFAQIDIKGDFSGIASQASRLLWNKINEFSSGDIELLSSIDSFENWISIRVENGVNIVDAFELYEESPEFVAIDKDRKYLIAIHSENISNHTDQLLLYFYKLEKNGDGSVGFINHK
ncbi:hypothetical protein L4D06_23745 [Enterovibrio makurazakiensis]|uniref:hypothetical protein n=1 Tax=Enterovibrio makurazakiensis TaxID=2910232 RepID=UPI003D1F36D5